MANEEFDRNEMLKATFARLDPVALAIAGGIVCAFVLVFATALLLFVGAPPGIEVGYHLGLLAHFLPGYSVSISGALIGLLYGFFIGALLGFLMAAVWNVTHHIYIFLRAARMLFDQIMN